MPDALAVRGLTKRFGSFTAVDQLSFSVAPGEVVGFLGPNGAGKTTTLKMVMGLLRPSAGTIQVMGLDAQHKRRQVKRILGYMSQKFSLYPMLTALENIEFFGGICGLSRAALRESATRAQTVVAPEWLRLPVKALPPGVRQKVALYVCLLPDPQIILLDEPTSGVDPEVRRLFWQEIYELKRGGKTLMVTTHNLDEAEFCDRILIIDRGQIVLEGEPQQLLAQRQADSVETLFKEVIAAHATS